MNEVLDIEIAARAWLLQQSEITSVVAQRIYPDAAPQGAVASYLVQSEFDGDDIETLAGTSELRTATLAIAAVSTTATGSRRLRNLVARVVPRMARQRIQTKGGGDIFINGVNLVSQDSEYEPPTDGSSEARYSRAAEFAITYSAWPKG